MFIMKKNLYLYIFLFFSFFLIIFSFNSIISLKRDQKKSVELNNKLKKESLKKISNINTNLVNPPENKNDVYWSYINEDFLKIDLTDLVNQNNDTVGWIKVNGTTIDYPIVQSSDNEFYLSHSFDKTENRAGWIFSDFRNNLNNFNYNSVIYGHRLRDNTMFGNLTHVLEDEWYNDKNNHIIKLSTLKYETIWQIFSIYTIYKESYYITTNFKTLDSYQKFLDTISKRSQYYFYTTVNTNDKILTLSTCKDSYGHRLVVHAKLIKKGTKSL